MYSLVNFSLSGVACFAAQYESSRSLSNLATRLSPLTLLVSKHSEPHIESLLEFRLRLA